ncbi:unnamed protein product [Gadus morhua 'NCC']
MGVCECSKEELRCTLSDDRGQLGRPPKPPPLPLGGEADGGSGIPWLSATWRNSSPINLSGETLDVDAVSLRFPVRRQEWPSVRLSTKKTRTICKDFRRTLTGDLLRALLDRKY